MRRVGRGRPLPAAREFILRIISFETSTPRASVAFLDETRGEEAVRRFDAEARLSRVLIPALRDLGKELWPAAEADLIVTALGPGAFTGLRVGMAAAKGLAFVAGLPVVAVSSLAAIAKATEEPGVVVAAFDARGGFYFYAAYDNAPPYPKEVFPPRIGNEDALASLPYGVYAGPPAAASAWLEHAADDIRRLEVWPDAVVLGRLGAHAFERRGSDDVTTLRPNYLKRGQV
jgi:tRNA threonylcarbamoyladenosine biosynthesis protein TsaB